MDTILIRPCTAISIWLSGRDKHFQRPMNTLRTYQRGVTLIELMVTLLVVAILGLVAIPSYKSATVANQVASEANNLLGDMEFARSEAIKRGQIVVVCPSTTSTTCSGSTTWNTGWIAFVPASASCTATGGAANDQVVRVQKAFTSTDSANYTPTTGGNTSLCFNRLGFSPSANTGLVKINAIPGSAYFLRCVALASVGHPQVLKAGQTDTSGSLSCTYP